MTRHLAGSQPTTCRDCHEPFTRSAAKPGTTRCDACREARRHREIAAERHLVATVHFVGHDGPDGTAPLECTCSWTGIVDDWHDHRAGRHLRGFRSEAAALYGRTSYPAGGPTKRSNPPGAQYR